jgi:probable DNA repair protein
MESAFLALGPELLAAARRGPVLTPNERLAREVVRYLQAAPELEKLPVICTSWHGWLTRLYSNLNRRHDHPRLLTAAGFRLRIAELKTSDDEVPIELIDEAWTLCHQYHLQPANHSSAGEHFQRWSLALEERLRATHSLSSAELELQLASTPLPCGEITLAGFDDLNPAQRRLLTAWRTKGLVVNRLDTPEVVPASAVRVEVPKATDEIRQAAWWAHAVLQNDPAAKIGVLVPGLESRRDAVLRQFTAILDPAAGSASARVDVAGGTSLDRTPLWQDAEVLLRSLIQPVTTTRLLRVVRSVHFTLEASFRPGSLPALTTLQDLIAHSGNVPLRRLVDQFEMTNDQSSLLVHLETVQRILRLAGWEHSGAGSIRFQVQQATARAIRALAMEAAWHAEPVDFRTALDCLAAHLGESVHAPERSPAPVRIMGYLETPGLAFTHLWITGTGESALPGPAHPNPLLPVEAMRLAGVKRMDAASERAFAHQLVKLWRSQARHLVVSHAALETGEHLSGSLLLRDIPLVEITALNSSASEAHAWLRYQRDCSEIWEDSEVELLPPGRLPGGTGLLTNQALCSFRAFGCHRLGLAEPEEPHALLDPPERGMLLHKVLEDVMQAFPSRDALAGAGADDFDRFIRGAYKFLDRSLPQSFVAAESVRLQRLLAAWQALEVARNPFSVIDTEHRVELHLDQWHLNLKLDRIDQTESGSIIIDYKSGAPRTMTALQNDGAAAAPQLPAYALTLPEAVGVFYLNFGDKPAARGIGSSDPGMGRCDRVADWEERRELWREQLMMLVHAFVRGPVQALPANRRTCERCHIRPICRIDQPGDESTDDEDADTSLHANTAYTGPDSAP